MTEQHPGPGEPREQAADAAADAPGASYPETPATPEPQTAADPYAGETQQFGYWSPPPPAGYGYGFPAPPAAGPTPAQRRGRARMVVAGVVGAALIATGGVAIGATEFSHNTTTGNGTAAAPGAPLPNPGTSSGSGSSTSQQVATASQQVGVVDIDTVLGYQRSAAAGTGLVLTSNGEILTNNHVIFGATQIKVTIVNSGHSYTATVVGTSPTQDVAVLQLQGASGLKTANIGNSSSIGVGAQVTGVGNAGGSGGTPSAAVGKVTALNQAITAASEGGGDTQHLTGLIETNAGIQPGDSGGPMFDANDKVIGLNTAAEQQHGTTTASYAIPINTARAIAGQIEAGRSSSTVHLGYPAFLGVSLAAKRTDEARVSGVLEGGPAAKAGITAGSVITAVGGTSVTTAASLKTVLSGYKPNQSTSVTWKDANGASHTATVTLMQGPAD